MKYLVEDAEMGPYIATCGGMICNIEYVKLENTGNGYKFYVDGKLRAKINYAEMWYLKAALRILESHDQMLSDMDIYKLGDKI